MRVFLLKSDILFIDRWLTSAGYSYGVARFADHVVHDGHDTELVPHLLEAGEQRRQHSEDEPYARINQAVRVSEDHWKDSISQHCL